MRQKKPKIFIQDKESKNFIEAVQTLVSNKEVKGAREIADRIGWSEAAISNVKAGIINIPLKYIKTFEKEFSIPILTSIENSDIQNRLLRIEANIEVFQIAIAGLKAKKTEDFEDKFSELQTLISKAVKRRKEEQET